MQIVIFYFVILYIVIGYCATKALYLEMLKTGWKAKTTTGKCIALSFLYIMWPLFMFLGLIVFLSSKLKR